MDNTKIREVVITMGFPRPSRESFSAYLKLGRFHSLSGVGYLLIPCWWGLLLAAIDGAASSPATSSTLAITRLLLLMLLFALGAICMRACGCAWNDLLDRKIDAQSRRTRTRPLASGVLSVKQAVGFISVMLFAGALVLFSIAALAPNSLLPILVVAVVPFAMLYPLAKRVTYFPQVVLGCVFNWGVLCGFAALSVELTFGAGLLFAAGVCWTVVYDTIYAFQDLEDDKRTKTKSLTFLLQRGSAKNILRFLYCIFLAVGGVSIYIAAGLGAGRQPAFSITVVLCSILLLLWFWFSRDIRCIDFAEAGGCMKFFKRELWRGGGGVLCVLLWVLLTVGFL